VKKIFVNVKVMIWNGCETLSLALMEEPRLRVFQNQVLRIYEPKRDEVTGGWSNLLSEELHNL
jgi:hypothetical protein